MTDDFKQQSENSEGFQTYAEPQLVTVRLFEREYQIKSDQPQLVELLAAEINREAKKLREMQPNKMGPGHFDWPVQVAFHLALDRFRAQEAYNTLKAQVEAEAEKIARRLNMGLGEVEAEKLARKITADLEIPDPTNKSIPSARSPKPFTATGHNLRDRINASLNNLDSDCLQNQFQLDLEKVRSEAEKIARDLVQDSPKSGK